MKFLFAVALMCLPYVLCGAERINSIEVRCNDGVVKRYNPFNNSLSPEKLCGESLPPEGDFVDPEFIAVFGPEPTQENSALNGSELRRAKFIWNDLKLSWGGVVNPIDLRDPDNHPNPSALGEAVGIDRLTSDNFTDAKVQELQQAYRYYEVGEFKFILLRGVYLDPDMETYSEKYRVKVVYTNIPGYLGSGDNTINAPAIALVQAQIKLTQRGVCIKNKLGNWPLSYPLPENDPCME